MKLHYRRDAAFVSRAACAVTALALLAASARADDHRQTRNVVLVTIDGLRAEEIFAGASGDHVAAIKSEARRRVVQQSFQRADAAESRAALLPFVWSVIARDGQLLGDEDHGSRVRVTNGRNYSYPGYSEMLTGIVDPRIGGNERVVNPHPNVLEWLDDEPGLQGRVAVFASWDLFPLILGGARSKVAVDASGPPVKEAAGEAGRALNELSLDLPAFWEDVRLDAVTIAAALRHLRAQKPRVLYVALGETDEWAHAGSYDLYLDAAHRADAFLARLWTQLQKDPAYRGRTTLVVTTDHGRGRTTSDWTQHGPEVPGADRIWLAVIGPDTPALGVRSDAKATQAQVAATLAALLGRDFRSRVPAAAAPVQGVIGAKGK
jgi:hypothetical protein